jgi:hypothetical protein
MDSLIVEQQLSQIMKLCHYCTLNVIITTQLNMLDIYFKKNNVRVR